MGEVYRARDTRLERTVAIKILPALLSADLVRKQRFEREAKTISGLNHPSICTLHDIGSQDDVDSNFAVGAVNPLFETRAYRSISGGFDVAADGQRFIVAYEPGQPNAAIALVENWDAGLKKK